MSLTISCPACNKQYRVDEHRSGRKLKCPCGEVFRAPGARRDFNTAVWQNNSTTAATIFDDGISLDLLSEQTEACAEATSRESLQTAAQPGANGPASAAAVQPVASQSSAGPVEIDLAQPEIESAQSVLAERVLWRRPNILSNFRFCNNVGVRIGIALLTLGLGGLILPHFGLQFAKLEQLGSPDAIRAAAICFAVAAALVLFFSQGKNLAAGVTLLVGTLLALIVVCVIPEDLPQAAANVAGPVANAPAPVPNGPGLSPSGPADNAGPANNAAASVPAPAQQQTAVIPQQQPVVPQQQAAAPQQPFAQLLQGMGAPQGMGLPQQQQFAQQAPVGPQQQNPFGPGQPLQPGLRPGQMGQQQFRQQQFWQQQIGNGQGQVFAWRQIETHVQMGNPALAMLPPQNQMPQHQDPRTPEDLGLPHTDKIGGKGGVPFALANGDRRPLLGFYSQQRSLAGDIAISDLTPVYFKISQAGPNDQLVSAKDGYAVGGLIICADSVVRAVKVIFMRLENGRLNPFDTYQSDWLGSTNHRNPQTISGDSKTVLGVFGGKSGVINSLGLILSKD